MVTTNTMSSLLEISHELLHIIFAETSPADLAALSASCRTLHSYVRSNRLLHKDLYVRFYDEPRQRLTPTFSTAATSSTPTNSAAEASSSCESTPREKEPDWEEELHKLVRMDKILNSTDIAAKRENLGFVAEQIEHLVQTASTTDPESSQNLALLRRVFQNDANIDTFLCSSSLFARAGNDQQQPAETEEMRQASAKLHCYYGVPIDSTRSAVLKPRLTHPFARSKVYDLREYTLQTLWGPFRADGSGRVDWEKVEAIMIVLGYNLNKFAGRSEGRFQVAWNQPFDGATAGSFRSPPKEPELKRVRELALGLDAQDPFGVSGSWMRVVCFLDYNDLYSFNFTERIPEGQARDGIETEEAIRLIRIKLQVTRIDPPGSDGLDWSNFTGTRLPVVHFRGTSRSLHASWDPNANSRIRGTVRQTPEGEIRWTTFSIFHGEERWRSEGIQVGGRGSKRGVLGNWFDKDYDMHGPAGPTAFWKESDEVGEEKGAAGAAGGPLSWF
ncbi:uncharacterized protein MYCGRDRAFT_75577 [Zymoseptoria tritici IPO323]|uniref:F-box domain-containing protein n=1 Tax=Zymoseptoria tritici (strain CBS 115943 / IPO323) TaxID=336722 RepID=F9XKA3_ZYMTI|nr:uncharacterized protein MYCGRDRAFT_75577 [Zymoseptoria tritici IPO323]EGP84676.1 hypothetical protein MYCGRDRAFT_75577 [Zymoseptoria tritici IPO323]